MYRKGNKASHRSRPSMESALEQREGRPFCPNCQRFFKHKETVWIGHRQCRCPICGELLDRRMPPIENGQAPSDSGKGAV